MSKKLILAGAGMLLALAEPALACNGNTVLLEDNFVEVDPAWSVSDAVSIGSGKLSVTPQPGYTSVAWYNGQLFDDADICIALVTPTARKPEDSAGGIMFFWSDWDNYFTFSTSGGKAAVVRHQKGKYLTPISWRDVTGMNAKPGSPNTLRLTLKGNVGTVYVNDMQIAAFKYPQGASTKLGLFGSSPKEGGPVTWTFRNLKITDVAAMGPGRLRRPTLLPPN